jgi:hypothetical protein
MFKLTEEQEEEVQVLQSIYADAFTRKIFIMQWHMYLIFSFCL